MTEFNGRSGTYQILGTPTPLARARFSSRHVYDSQKAQKFVHGTLIRSQQQDPDLMFNGPLQLLAMFYFPIPKAQCTKTRGVEHNYRLSTPDLDNLIKYILDMAQGILYPNDSLFCRIEAYKLYDDNPRTVFTITEL